MTALPVRREVVKQPQGLGLSERQALRLVGISPSTLRCRPRNGAELRFIQPGKRVQNASIEGFNSRFRDECLSQHGFVSLSPMRSVIDNAPNPVSTTTKQAPGSGSKCDETWEQRHGRADQERPGARRSVYPPK